MLPFGRMFGYGKVQEVPYIKDIKFGVSSSFPTMVLLSSGDMYMSGYNDSGQLGDGTKNNRYRVMKLTASNVRLCSCSAYSSIYVGTDNVIYLAGDRAIQRMAGSAIGYTTFTDVNSYFPGIDVSQIKKIVCEYNTGILMNDGKLYGIGLNRYGEFGLGSAGYKPLTLIAEDVKDFSMTDQSCVYIKNDGTVWGSGYNAYYCLQTSTDGGVNDDHILTFQQLNANIPEEIIKIKLSRSNVCLFSITTMYSTGTNANGCFGDGNDSTSNTNTTGVRITTPLPMHVLEDSRDIFYTTGFPCTGYIGVDNKMYVTGYNNYGSLGLGPTPLRITAFTSVPNITLNDTEVWVYNQYNTYIGRKFNEILGCGQATLSISMDTYTNELKVLLDLPWL